MRYKVMYLPVEEEEITDGCTVISADGSVFAFNEADHLGQSREHIRPAALFVVSYRFNMPVVLGRPTAAALKWLKAGMEFRLHDCKEVNNEVHIACPVCGVKH